MMVSIMSIGSMNIIATVGSVHMLCYVYVNYVLGYEHICQVNVLHVFWCTQPTNLREKYISLRVWLGDFCFVLYVFLLVVYVFVLLFMCFSIVNANT